MTLPQAEAILEQIVNDPVAGIKALRRYDPMDVIGFCFGRAAFVHWLSLWFYRVHPDNIAKLWAVGKMEQGPDGWTYHVSTMLRHTSGPWLVIDPRLTAPVSPKAWFDYWNAFASEGDTQLFATSAKRLFPSSSAGFSRRLLSSAVSGKYFRDLVGRFRAGHRYVREAEAMAKAAEAP